MATPCCPVGARHDAADIDAALRAGKPLRAIASKHGLSYSAVQRHAKHALQDAHAPADPPILAPPTEDAATPPPSAEEPHSQPEPPPTPCETTPPDDDEPATPEPSDPPAEDMPANVIRGRFGGDSRRDSAGKRGGESKGRPHRKSKAEEEEEARARRIKAIDDARARGFAVAELAESYGDRVGIVADLIASGQYEGHATVKRLALLWGVVDGAVQNYARAAAVMVKADRGEIETRREVSLGKWEQLREEARTTGDLKAAIAAQAGYDRAAGVVEPGGAKVQINLMDDRRVKTMLQVVIAALTPFPEARQAALDAAREALRPALPGRVITTEGS